MGSTLEHGIYLPSEGEKNCYQGLASNWNKVDGALGDVAELKQSIESKFTKEIVTELPTENINPFCIYMILKTDPETDNIYDEWVYINNSWEYLGNTKVDMTQYYTKQEVNELPAVASGVTATKVGNYDTHIANGDIHVTTSDKTKWTNSANTHVLRLALSALTPSTSDNSFSNLDDSTALKVGDKVMDTAGVLFEVTAIDTQNSTFTIGTALIDLAQDSDVVHKSGDETVGGVKAITFITDVIADNRVYGTYGDVSNPKADKKANLTLSSWNSIGLFSTYIQDYSIGFDVRNGYIHSTRVYADEYYYGSNNVEFSNKFVTTDTAQTVSGQKVFTDINAISNSAEIGVSGGYNSFKVLDKNNKILARLDGGTFSSGMAYSQWLVNNGTDVFNGVSLYQPSANLVQLRPYSSTLNVQLGASNRSFSDCYTSKINGVEPSSLSLPSGNANDVIDISSYLTYLDGSPNTYTASVNGWISITMSNCAGIQAYISGLWGHSLTRPSAGDIRFLMPISKNLTANILIFGGTIDNARFIPCQGNV